MGFELKKRSYIEKYIPHVAEALKQLVGYSQVQEDRVKENLHNILEKKRGKIDKMEFDPTKNVDYDAEFAKIGTTAEPEESEDE